MKFDILFLSCLMGGVLSLRAANTLDEKAKALVSKMTLEEKLDLIHGNGCNMAGIERLGIPEINMSDASMGVRVTPWPACKGLEPSTAFPASILLAATWNPDQVDRYATAVSEEYRARNMHILLGPGINIYRNPLCGRNYEYFGEDPFLAASMVVPYVKAVRQVGCITTVKHFVANNSEPLRKEANSIVSERALREIYFPAFKAAVQKGDTLGIMNAYNLLNGVYCGEDTWLLKEVLRKEWGFRGFVVSDWSSLWNSELAANSGVSIEMPGENQCRILAPEKLQKLLEEGKTTEEEIDSKIFDMVRACLEMDMYQTNWANPKLKKLDEHAQIALETAREGMVLLKNKNGVLPLEPSKVQKIVVIGPTAEKTPTSGGGSGGVLPENPVSIWQAVHSIYGDKAELLKTFDSEKVAKADAVLICVGYNTGLILDDYRKKEGPKDIGEEQANFNDSETRKDLDFSEHEGNDREEFSLPKGDNELIEKCAALNSSSVVLYVAGSGISMPWVDEVVSILWMGYPGQNGCIAAAEIVAGKINPSGKLPITIEKRLEDNAAFGHFGLSWDKSKNGVAKMAGVHEYWDILYPEGIFVGYRHMDQEQIEPQFPFGYGLSYTSFKYGDIVVKKRGDKKYTVTLSISNEGKRDGAEVVQLYVADEQCSVPRPPKELKGFKKVFLKAGESKTVKIELDSSAFAFWHPEIKKWTVEPGNFDLLAGSSSRDIRSKTVLEIK